MKYLIAISLLLGLLLISCEDDSTETTEMPKSFSCEVTLVNDAGEPLPGYLVQLTSFNIYINEDPMHHMEYVLNFSLEGTRYTEVVMMDYWGTFVDSLLSENLGVGAHSVAWSCDNYDDAMVNQGVYKYSVTTWDEDELDHSATRFMYVIYPIENGLPGVLTTSDQGGAMFTDIIELPGLYCTEEIARIDEDGNMLGYYDFSSSNYILVMSPDGEMRYAERTFSDQENSFRLVWDELTTIE